MTYETFARCVRQPRGLKQRLRATSRGVALSALGMLRSGRGGQRALRFLMAHYVFDDQRVAFERQISMLCGMGDFVSTDNALTMLTGEAPIDGTYFHLSFDDGLDCLARNALPVLDAAQVPALVFVNSAVAGTPAPEERFEWERATNYAVPLKTMDWETLARSGFEVGAHTRTHMRLTEISDDSALLKREIVDCKAEIEAALDRPCRYFAWPFGLRSDVDEKSLTLIQSAGFEAAFGAFRAPIVPEQTDRFMIPRHHFEPQWPVAHVRFFACGGSAGQHVA